jgi:hypothetical protein
MAVTWKQLGYQVDVSTADSKAVSAASMATSEGVVRAAADASLVVVASTADSKGVSAGVLASTALSTSNSADVAQGTTISTADSKGVSAGTAASVADSKAVSEGVVRSTADSSLSARTLNSWATATGNVAFGGYQGTDFVVQNVATSAAITGVTPILGKLVFNVADLNLWVNTAII